MISIQKLIKSLPKIDLHCHLDGSVRTQTVLDLARRQNYLLPADNVKELRKYVRVSPDCRSLSEFLERFEVFYPLLKTSYALERITYELLRDCSLENTKYMEIRFAPVLQKTENFPVTEVVESVLKGLERGRSDFDIKAGVILCLYRGTSGEEIKETAECALKMKNYGVCGVDIAGDETLYGLSDFCETLDFCRENGINMTIHAGESGGPQNIAAAIKRGASRIGHGIALQKDRRLYRTLIEKEIPLEICITSNVQTQVVNDYGVHPFREFYKKGVKITLNTDDRGVSGIDLTHEYNKAVELGLKIDELKDIILNGVKYSFQDEREKDKMKQEFKNLIEERMQSYEK